jgi:hypothetical protein
MGRVRLRSRTTLLRSSTNSSRRSTLVGVLASRTSVAAVAFGAERHPPCTLKYCDVPILAMKVRSADTAGRECFTNHVYPWLRWIAKEYNLTGPFQRPQIFRLCRDKPMSVRFRGLPSGQRNGKKERSEDEVYPFDRVGACHGRCLCNVGLTLMKRPVRSGPTRTTMAVRAIQSNKQGGSQGMRGR